MIDRVMRSSAGVVRPAVWCAAAALSVAVLPAAWGHFPDEREMVWAQPQTDGELADPVAVRLVFADGRRVSGRVIAAGTMGLSFVEDGALAEARWVELQASSLASVWPRLRDGESAEAWLELGGWLSTMEGASRQERVAFQRARSIDAAVATDEAIEQAKAEAQRLLAGGEAEGEGEGQPEDGSAEGAAAGPVLGAFDASWPELTDEQYRQYTDELRAFAEPLVSKVAPNDWKVAETDYFLLYTDLPASEARSWANLLDKMYDRMRVVFRVPEGENVFRGRCLITIWSTTERFNEWVLASERFDLSSRQGIAGVCFGKANGDTHVTFYRQPDRNEFALVLVHEASHAFTHRYRTGRRIPSWVNEGLAEYVSHNLVNAPQWATGRARGSREGYQRNGGLATLFVMPSIDWYQYGQAWEFTEMMVGENVDGYRAFIDALKDGKDVHEALEEHYGTSLDRLVRHYARVYDRSGSMNFVRP